MPISLSLCVSLSLSARRWRCARSVNKINSIRQSHGRLLLDAPFFAFFRNRDFWGFHIYAARHNRCGSLAVLDAGHNQPRDRRRDRNQDRTRFLSFSPFFFRVLVFSCASQHRKQASEEPAGLWRELAQLILGPDPFPETSSCVGRVKYINYRYDRYYTISQLPLGFKIGPKFHPRGTATFASNDLNDSTPCLSHSKCRIPTHQQSHHFPKKKTSHL